MYPIKPITIEKMRQLEREANEQGLSYAEMMENAGRCTARAIRRRIRAKGKRVVILVGPGNNGGDGLVVAHYLKEAGARVCCYLWKRNVEQDSNYQRIQHDARSIVWAEDDADHAALRALVTSADIIVDSLLGIGVTRPIDGELAEILQATRQALAERRMPLDLAETVPQTDGASSPLIVAVDCPTGLNCDTGDLDPAALQADMTVTFAHPKVGMLRFPGAEAVGEIVVADIGIAPELTDDVPVEMASPARIREWLPNRPRSAHKGTFGRALVVAGSVNYVGAAALAGAGAKRVGTGLVTMALPMPIQPAVAANLTEATYLLLPHDMGVISSGAVKVLQEEMSSYDALLLGPGLTQEDASISFVHAMLGLEEGDRKGHIGFRTSSAPETIERPPLPPLVIDADGLNALVGAEAWWKALPANTILTPHPGEMARLVGNDTSTSEIQSDREGMARRMAEKWGTVVLLKGAFSVIAAPEGRVTILPFANPGLATAGSGDVLAGAIVGLRAQGMDAYEAAVTGAYLHGLAGEIARSELGDMGTVAGDLPSRLTLALKRIR